MAKSVRRNLVAGIALVFLLIVGLGGWASVASISGAVISSGNLIVESSSTQIQHLEGGIVSSVDVEEGDHVAAGDILITLNPSLLGSSLAELSRQYDERRAQDARLNAEQAGEDTLQFPVDLETAANSDPRIAEILSGQRALKTARQESLESQKSQLLEQIEQFGRQTEGITIQRAALSEEIVLIQEQVETQSALFDRGLNTRSEVISLMRERINAQGVLGELGTRIAQIEQTISERRIQIIQLDDAFRESVQQEQQEVRLQVSVLAERIANLQDQLSRLEIRAPIAGVVHEIAIHSVGGVVAPGQVLLHIVPQQVQLVIESEIAAIDIDEVFVGQSARVRIVALDMRETPELTATIDRISPDIVIDERLNTRYYKARLVFDAGEVLKLDDGALLPGMPVDAFVQTGNRTVMAYLLKPLFDQFSRALKE